MGDKSCLTTKQRKLTSGSSNSHIYLCVKYIRCVLNYTLCVKQYTVCKITHCVKINTRCLTLHYVCRISLCVNYTPCEKLHLCVKLHLSSRRAKRAGWPHRAERSRRDLSALWASRRASAQAVTSKWHFRTTSPTNTNSSAGEN